MLSPGCTTYSPRHIYASAYTDESIVMGDVCAPFFHPDSAMDNVPKYVFWGLVVIVVGGLVALGIVNRSNKPVEPPIQGAGSSFVHPLMVQWSSQHEKNEDGFRIVIKP